MHCYPVLGCRCWEHGTEPAQPRFPHSIGVPDLARTGFLWPAPRHTTASAPPRWVAATHARAESPKASNCTKCPLLITPTPILYRPIPSAYGVASGTGLFSALSGLCLVPRSNCSSREKGKGRKIFIGRLHSVHGWIRSPNQAWARTSHIQQSKHCPAAIISREHRLALLPSFRCCVFAHRTPARHRSSHTGLFGSKTHCRSGQAQTKINHGHLIRVRPLIRLLHGARFIGRRYRRPNQQDRHYKFIRTPTPKRYRIFEPQPSTASTSLRRLRRPRPIRPTPNRVSVVGSGTRAVTVALLATSWPAPLPPLNTAEHSVLAHMVSV